MATRIANELSQGTSATTKMLIDQIRTEIKMFNEFTFERYNIVRAKIVATKAVDAKTVVSKPEAMDPKPDVRPEAMDIDPEFGPVAMDTEPEVVPKAVDVDPFAVPRPIKRSRLPTVFHVERILDHRKTEFGRDEWLVRWAGFGPEEDSWEPRESFFSDAPLRRYEQEQSKKTRKDTPKPVPIVTSFANPLRKIVIRRPLKSEQAQEKVEVTSSEDSDETEQISESKAAINPNLTQVAPRIVRIRMPKRKAEPSLSETQTASPIVAPETKVRTKSRSPTVQNPDEEASMESDTMHKIVTLRDLTLQIDEEVNEPVRQEIRMRRELQNVNRRINEIREQIVKDTDTETTEPMVLDDAQAEVRLQKQLEWHSQVIDALESAGFMPVLKLTRESHIDDVLEAIDRIEMNPESHPEIVECLNRKDISVIDFRAL